MANTLVVENGRVFTSGNTIEHGYVVIEQGRIAEVGTGRLPAGVPGDRIDVLGRAICPGFIDVHVNGGGGALAMDATQSALDAMSSAHARTGTTSVLPTTVAWSPEEQAQALKAIAAASERQPSAARVLGAHMEGPFLNASKGGAHNPDYLVAPSIAEFDRFWEVSNGALLLMTVSPELEGADVLIAHALERGVRIQAGHSAATVEQAMEAFDRGVGSVAHLFNGMTPLTAREPGLMGASLVRDDIYVELIADGVHVHPANLELCWRIKGSDRVVLVTDAIPPAGAKGFTWLLEGMEVEVRGNTGYLPDGTICGSALTLGEAVQNMNRLLGVPLADLVKMASVNPARMLGLEDTVGDLRPGLMGDIVVLDDDLSATETIVGGAVIWQQG